jgi:hypothetical protein
MAQRLDPARGEERTGGIFAAVAYAIQFFFGGWFFFNGLNYFAEFTPSPPGSSPLSRELIAALEVTGLFAVVKAVELVAGTMLLLNRLVPLALLLAAPVSFAIVWVMLVLNGGAVGTTVGILTILFSAVMMFARLGSFMPVLAWDDTNLHKTGYRSAMPPLRPPLHAIAIVLGIAVPVGIELGTMAYFQSVARASATAGEIAPQP